MPYIKRDRRSQLAEGIVSISNAGDLNYAITELINEFLCQRGVNYANLNEVVGALECCKLELTRRIIGPYEDTKIKSNGDVYTVLNLIRSKGNE